MNVALAGLTAREETALVMLIGKTLPDFHCDTVSPERQAPLPLATLYVLDLAGRGWARWTQEAQDDLLRSLNGAPAVLVAPAFDETWTALEGSQIQGQSLVMLHKPYGINDMRAALLKAAPQKPPRAARLAPITTVRKAAAPNVEATQVTDASEIVTPALTTPARQPETPSSAEPPVVVIAPLSFTEFQARVNALPNSEPKLFLRQLVQALAKRQPFEVRVTLINRLIFNPEVQWAASNIAQPVLETLCQSDSLAEAMSIDPIEGRDALGRAERLGMRIHPLANFLGTLMHHGLNRPQ